MATINNSCPYRIARKVAPITFPTVEERFDFQIGENGLPEIISLGEFDVIKEVDSHKGEVGLINVLKLAQARGLDPLSAFAKNEPGIMADIGDIETFDDLLKAKASADAKLASIAKQYGITTEQLLDIMKKGDLSSLKEAADPGKGGDENA